MYEHIWLQERYQNHLENKPIIQQIRSNSHKRSWSEPDQAPDTLWLV